MKLISLNTWGGRAGREGLLAFLDAHRDADFICLQEVWSAPYEGLEGGSPLVHDAIMVRGKQEIGALLGAHRAFFHPSHLADYGLMTLVSEGLEVVGCGDVFVHRERGFVPEGNLGHHARNVQFVTARTPSGVNCQAPHRRPRPEERRRRRRVSKDAPADTSAQSGTSFETPPRITVRGSQAPQDEGGVETPSLGVPNGAFTVLNFHGLWNGRGKSDSDDRLAQSRRLVDVLHRLKAPFVLCGDFNLAPDTKSLAMLEEAGARNLNAEFGARRHPHPPLRGGRALRRLHFRQPRPEGQRFSRAARRSLRPRAAHAGI